MSTKPLSVEELVALTAHMSALEKAQLAQKVLVLLEQDLRAAMPTPPSAQAEPTEPDQPALPEMSS